MKIRQYYDIKNKKSYDLISLDTLEEEFKWWERCVEGIIKNPRYYLDNLEYLPIFRMSEEGCENAYGRKRPRFKSQKINKKQEFIYEFTNVTKKE